MIKAERLVKHFDELIAVNDISFQLQPGSITALLGANGAGKTTTLRMLAGVMSPSSGVIKLNDVPVNDNPVALRQVVGAMAELPGIYPKMNAVSFLLFFGRVYNVDEKSLINRIEELLTDFNLWEVRQRPLDTYSRGMKQRLMIARALIHDPQYLLLDEPTSTLDPVSARRVRQLFLKFKQQGKTILICTHNLKEVEEVADNIMFIKHGSIMAYGQSEQIRNTLLPFLSFSLRVHPDDEEKVAQLQGILKEITLKKNGVAGSFSYQLAPASLQEINPRLLRILNEKNIRVISLSEDSDLEEVYFKLEAEEGINIEE